MEEEFKTINYRGTAVKVSNLGTVIIRDRIKTPYLNSDGYLVVSVPIENGEWRSVGVHRLVALAFLPNPDNLPEIHHKDYNRQNPCVDNLMWVSREENVRLSKDRMPDYHGANNPNYNNHTLANKYQSDKVLSQQKQSRPGIRNGRSTQVDLYYDNTFVRSFDYIKLCCQYLIDEGITNAKDPEIVRGQLNTALREHRKYKGHYSIIKR